MKFDMKNRIKKNIKDAKKLVPIVVIIGAMYGVFKLVKNYFEPDLTGDEEYGEDEYQAEREKLDAIND